jgi:DNA ligase-1
LPDGTVIDGEIIPWKEGVPLPFAVMQTRIGRKNLSAKIIAEAPLVMVCYDLLEERGIDIRHLPLLERREKLISLLQKKEVEDILILSPLIDLKDWNEVANFRTNARDEFCEGLMIKRKTSPYETGRRKGNWWKWKTDPLMIDGVLLYAQSGSGRRANLLTDYTFAVWDEGVLVPFAKAYSGLTDKEIIRLDKWIRKNTLEKFGPVRSVKPEMVFEIAFEGINKSTRHKSGVALRFPRIARWREDKPVEEANTKEDLLSILNTHNL